DAAALVPTVREVELHAVAVRTNVGSAPVRVGAHTERLDTRSRQAGEPGSLITVGAENQTATARDQSDEPAERRPEGFHVGVDIRVVVLEIPDDGHVREVFQELCCLVEEGAVVLVTFDDEVPAPA